MLFGIYNCSITTFNEFVCLLYVQITNRSE
ncbi:hypothetical protein DSL72_003113 [Monilinia vaccinii-corymbosi]|uniref:Uncharacterized protein n=1 Tax=Monilinia vaccinii-corymbosi TaxID=61207 RepID=A0A8A3NYW7_9HELO|nr:hypothetical protein DSL72_003113 [Monilinia vaccinii-corymbosi]